MKKVFALAKYIRIKTLEDLVIKVGYKPEKINAIEELVKKNNLDIETLRKQLKFPAIEYPLSKDIEEKKTQKVDMINLIIE